MRTVKDILRDADPVPHEPIWLDQQRDGLRRSVMAAAAGATTPSPAWRRRPVNLLAALVLIVAGLVATGAQLWPQSGATLQAAVRFEVRLAEDRRAAGLREARVTDSDQVIYLHDEVIVSNEDVAQSTVVPGDGSSRFAVSVQFNAAGAQKMQRATSGHIGRLVAILIDGQVVTAPLVRTQITESALIDGAYTKAAAERIVNGIGLR